MKQIRMKVKMSQIIYLALFCMVISCKPKDTPNYEDNFDVNIMSFNLRYDTSEDGENQWDNRKEACITMLNEVKPMVFGIQEGLRNQVNYLNEKMPQYSYVGVGRDDGHSGGEYAAIFYDTSYFDLLETDNFWLSETPETPSLGWDANNIRIVTWAKLKHKSKNKVIYVFNTHFDHKGKVSQQKSSELIAHKIDQIAEETAPVFLIGDFNMLIGSSRLKAITTKFFSAQKFAEITDNNKSYNAFGVWIINRNIDFIFYEKVKVLAYKTIVKDYGVPFISDHYPILAYFNY